jgi:hypothetical protein
VFSLKTNVHTLTAIVPVAESEPNADRKREIPIATDSGSLMMNRLRQLLRYQEMTKDNDPKRRFTVDVPNELLLQIVESYRRKTKAMDRMDRALDRKSKAIATLEKTLSDQGGIYNDYVNRTEAFTMLLGEVMELLDVVTEFRDSVIAQKGVVSVEQLATITNQIEATNDLLDEIMEESDDASEEEKDD